MKLDVTLVVDVRWLKEDGGLVEDVKVVAMM